MAAKPACGPAQTLLIEDALKKLVYRDGSKSIRLEKEKGLIPMGAESPFGDFPDGYGSTRSIIQLLVDKINEILNV